MNLQEILARLATKFTDVRKDGLEQLAHSIVLQGLSVEEVTALIDRLTPEQVAGYVKEFRSSVDKEKARERESLERSIRKKYNIKEGEESHDPQPTPKQDTQGTRGGEATNPEQISALIAEQVAQALKPLQDALERQAKKDTASSRLESLKDALKECKDETFTTQTLKDFGRMRFDTEEEFTEFLKEKAEDAQKATQAYNDNALSRGGAPYLSKRGADGVSASVKSYLEAKTPTDASKGKEI